MCVFFDAPAAHAATDTQPPVITQVSIINGGPGNPVAITSANGTGIVQLRITDNSSGFKDGCITIDTPAPYPLLTYATVCFTSADRIAGTARSGFYNVSIPFRRYAHVGFYPINTVSVRDVAGNVDVWSGFEFALNGWGSGLHVTGTSDVTNPTLVSFSMSQTSGDIAAGNHVVVTTNVHVTDDLSGVRAVFLNVQVPDGQVFPFLSLLDPADRVSGTATDGIYQGTMTFAAPMSPGVYTITSLAILDSALNSANLTTTELANGGFPTTVTIANSDATVPDPPTLVSAVALDRAATVNWSPPASDGGAPILDYTVTASPGGAHVTVPASMTTADVQLLNGATAYTFTVHARNGVGDSAESLPSAPVTTPPAPPARPTGVSATAGAGFATVSWSAPADGGSPITGYTLTTSPSGQVVHVAADQTSAIVTGLVGGNTYTFTLHATNALGDGFESIATPPLTLTLGVPDVVTNIWATAGDHQATVTWSPPVNDGGSPVVSYTVVGPNGPVVLPASQTTATLTGLANAHIYEFNILATNAAGDGPGTWSNPVTPGPPPDTPWFVTATAGNTQADVTWQQPCCLYVESFTVTASPGGNHVLVRNQTHATVTGLTNGVTYTFTVHATSLTGTSPESFPSNPVTPTASTIKVPAPPSSVAATAGDGHVVVAWQPPVDDGGSPILSYTVRGFPGLATTVVPAGTTSFDFTNLVNGADYWFWVGATNAGGDSAYVSTATVRPAGPPDVPTGVSAQAGDGYATVTWQPPVNNHGLPVTGYTVRSVPPAGSAAVPAAQTAVQMSGLTNGVSYTFIVTADNAAGTSTDSSPSNAVIPSTPPSPPDAPTAVHASIANGTVSVSWSAPNGHGLPITGYTVSTSPGGKTVNASGTHATVSGLSAGTYTFKVRATNGAGPGAWSSSSNAVSIVSVKGGGSGGGGGGYWMLGADGKVYAFGTAAKLGSATGPAVAIAARRNSSGYWTVDAAGNVSHFGTATGHGGHPALRAGEAVSTISATPSGNGYWLFTNRGRVFAYGDAHFYGDMSRAVLNGPIVASVATPTGHGYFMVGSDGGVFSFGDARFHGSTGGMHLNRPIVGISPTPDNHGYWLVASDGGVFAFTAPFRGSMGAAHLNRPVNGLVAYGNGYLMVASDGGVFAFSNKAFAGSLASTPPSAPIIGIATS